MLCRRRSCQSVNCGPASCCNCCPKSREVSCWMSHPLAKKDTRWQNLFQSLPGTFLFVLCCGNEIFNKIPSGCSPVKAISSLFLPVMTFERPNPKNSAPGWYFLGGKNQTSCAPLQFYDTEGRVISISNRYGVWVCPQPWILYGCGQTGREAWRRLWPDKDCDRFTIENNITVFKTIGCVDHQSGAG